MKLVIFGLTASSSWGNGHATLWRGLCRALGKRGHQVIFFERDVPYYASHRDLDARQDGWVRLYGEWGEVRRRAAAELADADAAMVTSYCPDAIDATELVLSSRARVRAFYDLDTPVTLSRRRRGADVDYLGPDGLRGFDLVLSYTGGEALEQLRHVLGARRVVPLYGSVDPAAHRPARRSARYESDLSYLGTYAADRQEMLERLFVEPARRLPWRRFLLGGSLYPSDFPWCENIRFLRHVAPPAHPEFFSSSSLTLNVTRATMAAMGYCPSGRLFEAAACGAPILTDSWAGLEEFFEPGSEILVASETEQVLDAMAMPPSELARIARAGRERALADHTADRRAEQMLRAIEESASAEPQAPSSHADSASACPPAVRSEA